MQGNRPAAVLLLVFLAALLLAAPAAVDAHSGRVVVSYAAAWPRTRRLEDEVAPELMGSSGGWAAGLQGGGGGIGYGSLDKNKPVCGGSCAGRSGQPYTRPCTYKDKCSQG